MKLAEDCVKIIDYYLNVCNTIESELIINGITIFMVLLYKISTENVNFMNHIPKRNVMLSKNFYF